MSAHFGETASAEAIWEAYRMGGRPKAFGLFTNGDRVAFACWIYLDFRDTGPSVDEFIEQVPEDMREVLRETLTAVLALADASTEQTRTPA